MNIELIKELREMSGAGVMDCKKALVASNNDLKKAAEWLRENGISKATKKLNRIAAEGLSTVIVDGNKAVILEVNCETDFVAKTDKFKNFVTDLAKTILESDAKTNEEALNLKCKDEGTISDYVTNMTATISEKISFRRFTLLTKSDDESFGEYIHMGGKISVLALLKGATSEVAKDVCMHDAAMHPDYVTKEDVPEEEVKKEKEILTEEVIKEGKPEAIAEKIVMGKISKFYKEVCLEEQEFVKDNSVTVGQYVKNAGGKIEKIIRYEVGEGMEKRQDNFAEEVKAQMGA